MRKIILTEEQFKTLKQESALNQLLLERINSKIIEEGLSINDDLEDELDAAEDVIIKKIQTAIPKPYKGTQGKDEGKENIKINGEDIIVSWKVYFFNTEQEKEQFESVSFIPLGYSESLKTIFLPVFCINGKIDYYELIDTFGHEVKHSFQTGRMGHDFNVSDAYLFAKTFINSEDNYKRNVATIIYASTKNEQDAFIEGLYRQISNYHTEKLIDYIIEDSEACSWLKKMYQAYIFIKEHQNDKKMIDIFKNNKVGYGIKKILKLGEEGINNLERKIGRVTKKAKKIFIKENASFNVSREYYLLAD